MQAFNDIVSAMSNIKHGQRPAHLEFVMTWFLNLIEDTQTRYSHDYHDALRDFHGYAERLCPELLTVGEDAKAQALRYQLRSERDCLSDAAQRELAAALPSPVRLSIALEHVEENQATYVVATAKNETDEQIRDWTIQLEIPPLLVVAPQVHATHVPEMSNKKRAVFRTTKSTAEQHPLWHGESYPFRIAYQLNEANQGVRACTVRATAYVDGRLTSEQIKAVDQLSTFFLPAVVARREAMAGVLRVATLAGSPLPKE